MCHSSCRRDEDLYASAWGTISKGFRTAICKFFRCLFLNHSSSWLQVNTRMVEQQIYDGPSNIETQNDIFLKGKL